MIKYIFLIILFATNAFAQGFHFEAESIEESNLIGQMQEAEEFGTKFIRYQIHTNIKNAPDTQENQDAYLNSVAYQMVKMENAIQGRSAFFIVYLDCPNNFMPLCLTATKMIYQRFNPYYRFLGVDPNEVSNKNWLKNFKDKKGKEIKGSNYAQQLINMVNADYPYKNIYIENFKGSPQNFSDMSILYGNFVPSVHIYWPGEITHQGLLDWPNKAYVWGKGEFTKKNLEKYLSEVISYQKKTGRKIFVGEFAAVRWSGFPKTCNAVQWTRDVLAIINKYDWDWTWHGYRGNSPWTPYGACNPNDMQEYPATWVMDEIKRNM